MALRFGDIVDVLLDTTFHITPHLSEFIDYMAMRVCVLIYRNCPGLSAGSSHA